MRSALSSAEAVTHSNCRAPSGDMPYIVYLIPSGTNLLGGLFDRTPDWQDSGFIGVAESLTAFVRELAPHI